jgi:tetratricopeptide (TPR) repeat protein
MCLVPATVVSVCLAASVPAFGQSAAEPPPSDDAARAEYEFQQGVAAYAAGRYHTAIDLFGAADRRRPRPELAYDIARAHEKLSNDSQAARFYREYLRRAGHPDDEAAVRGHLEQLESRLAAKELERAAWSASASTVPVVDTSSSTSRSETIQPAPVQKDATTKAGKKGSLGALTTLGIVGLATGAAALGAAVVFEVEREAAEANAEGEPEQIRFAKYTSAMETDRTAARVLAATGGVLVLTGGTLLFLGASASHADVPKVGVWVSPTALNVDATWRF